MSLSYICARMFFAVALGNEIISSSIMFITYHYSIQIHLSSSALVYSDSTAMLLAL